MNTLLFFVILLLGAVAIGLASMFLLPGIPGLIFSGLGGFAWGYGLGAYWFGR